MDKGHLKGMRNQGIVWACLFVRTWYGASGKTGLGQNANTYTRGAGRMKAGLESERGNAHVVFSAAKRQGGAIGESRSFGPKMDFLNKKDT